MKLSNCRVVQSSTQPAKNQRIPPQMRSWSSLSSRAIHQNHRENEQTRRVLDQMRHRRRAHQHPHRRSRSVVLMFSKLQRTPRQRHQTRWSSQKRSALLRPYHQQKAHCVSARRIYAPDQSSNSRRANRYQRHRSRPAVPMSSKLQKRAHQRRRSRRSSRDRDIPQ